MARALSGVLRQGARRVAARMRRALRQVRVHGLALNAHFGLAVPGTWRADARLYRAKRRPVPNGYT